MTFNIENTPSQQGRIAIVTGANTGLGYETALALAKKGAKVILACRNLDKAEAAKKSILDTVPEADLDILQIDLSKLNSVRKFAKSFQQQYDSLDLLINNAGVMMPPYSETEDGFELQFGANHLGHFLLTGLLLETILNTQGSRVVALSSLAHKNGKINFDDLHSKKKYSASEAYGQSKLANLMFAFELQRRLENAGHHQTIAVAAHPGIALTDLGRHFPKFLYGLITSVLGPIIAHKPDKGALPTLMAALDPNVKGGDYYGPTGFSEMKGKPGPAKSTDLANNNQVAERLWKVSEELTGIKFL